MYQVTALPLATLSAQARPVAAAAATAKSGHGVRQVRSGRRGIGSIVAGGRAAAPRKGEIGAGRRPIVAMVTVEAVLAPHQTRFHPLGVREERLDGGSIDCDDADELWRGNERVSIRFTYVPIHIAVSSLTVSRIAHIVLTLMPWMSCSDMTQRRIVAIMMKMPEQRRSPTAILRPLVSLTFQSKGIGVATIRASVLKKATLA